MRLHRTGLLIGAVVFLALPHHASAGIITSITRSAFPGFSTGSLGPVGAAAVPAPNNDDTSSASPNVIGYNNIFYNRTVDPLEVEFGVEQSGGTTEFFFNQTLFNLSGQTWTGFRFELGFGIGATFTPATGLDLLLDFDYPSASPTPFAPAFPMLNHQAQSIVWSGGAVGQVAPAIMRFSVDVPDNLQSYNPEGLSRFTIRQTPITPASAVPEPASIMLMGIGLGSLGWWGRRRYKR